MTESDPTGRDQHDSGAKLDAGKSLANLVLGSFRHALQEVVDVGTSGAQRYTPYGWLDVPDGPTRYMDALMRHYLSAEDVYSLDPQSGHRHLAHLAWNALAVLELTHTDKNA